MNEDNAIRLIEVKHNKAKSSKNLFESLLEAGREHSKYKAQDLLYQARDTQVFDAYFEYKGSLICLSMQGDNTQLRFFDDQYSEVEEKTGRKISDVISNLADQNLIGLFYKAWEELAASYKDQIDNIVSKERDHECKNLKLIKVIHNTKKSEDGLVELVLDASKEKNNIKSDEKYDYARSTQVFDLIFEKAAKRLSVSIKWSPGSIVFLEESINEATKNRDIEVDHILNAFKFGNGIEKLDDAWIESLNSKCFKIKNEIAAGFPGEFYNLKSESGLIKASNCIDEHISAWSDMFDDGQVILQNENIRFDVDAVLVLMINKFIQDRNYDYLKYCCEKIIKIFPDRERNIKEVMYDASILKLDVAGILEYTMDALKIREIFGLYCNENLVQHLSCCDIKAELVYDFIKAWRSKEYGLGVHGKKNKHRVIDELQIIIDKFKEENGYNIAADAINRFSEVTDKSSAIEILLEQSDHLAPISSIDKLKGFHLKSGTRKRKLFRMYSTGTSILLQNVNFIGDFNLSRLCNDLFKGGSFFSELPRTLVFSPSMENEAMEELLSYKFFGSGLMGEVYRSWFLVYLRKAENEILKRDGLPEFGAGWINEARVFNIIKSNFKEVNVIHQGKPSWLGKQSLDVYLPDYNIAIEYQGEQHSRPIEYFGGIEAFNQQKERDERKKRLCHDNGCILIEVYPGYTDESVIKSVKEAIHVVIESK